MTFLLTLAPALSLLVLGAHFLRMESYLGVGGCLALVVLVFVRRPWAARAVQVALGLGVLEWIRTASSIGLARADAGLPWMRMALILGAVALATGSSALVYRSRRLRGRYGIGV